MLAKEKLSLTDFPDFNDDEDVVRKAVLGNPHEFQFASQRLKDKKEFVLELLEPRRDNVFIIEYLSSSLKDDDEVAEKFMSISPGSYAYLGPTQKKKIAFAQACIDYSPLEAFAHMPEDLKKNKELAKLGFIKNPSCYMHFDEDLKRDQPFFLDILRSTSNQFDCVKMYPVLRKVLGEDKVRQEFQAKGMAMNTDGTFLIGNS
ncbi:MAG: DUF4116 domain-containing protein [Parachlamydiaceae bacterium]|nr:MAG: DUF4116 domain-containing protein [Parachlamydiaceae bacterium]